MTARLLSNRQAPYINDDVGKATNLVVCCKQTCAGSEELVKGMTSRAAKICIDDQPATETVRVSIPRAAKACTNSNIVLHDYQPIFDSRAMLNSVTFSLALPISPSTTMHYIDQLE